MNEIFKGMDNAAEVINENFQKGSIVEHNLNEENPENGHYVRYGNGKQECWFIGLPIGLTVGTGGVASSELMEWEYPASFVEDPVVSANSNNINRWANARGYIDRAQIVQWGTSLNSTEVLSIVYAIGRWKK